MAVEITVDARMADFSGIGRYFRAITVRRSANFGSVIWWGGEPSLRKVGIVRQGDVPRPARAKIYSVWEQFERADMGDVVWTPHYNFPVLARGGQIVTVHDLAHLALPEIFGGGMRRLYAWLYMRACALKADHVIFISRFTCGEFVKYAGRLPTSYSVVANGVDARWFLPLRERKSAGLRRVLAVGNVKPHKNLRRLFNALTPLGNSGVLELLIVGKLDGFITGEDSLTKTALPGVHWLGEVSDERLLQLYAEVDCFVMPSLYEGFGLPVLEAMAAGCLVAASTAEAIVETCGGREAQLAEFFDPHDEKTIREGILRVLALKGEEAAQRRARAQAHASLHTWDKAARHVWGLIESRAAFQAGIVI